MKILNRYDNSVIWEGDAASIADAVNKALALKVSLRSANLRSANLRSANLSYANLSCADLSSSDLSSSDLHYSDLSSSDLSYADLRSADLSCADLSCANLRSANLRSSDLSYSNLSYSDLSYANLRSANLRSANLSSSDLRSSDLSYANLRSADLRSANLRSANLSSSDLHSAKNAPLVIAQTRILPEGSIVGWKKCRNNVIVQLVIPYDAKRSHAFGRKCRAEFADVINIYGADEGVGLYDPSFIYRKGERVKPKLAFCETWEEECASGIHFFITREEAEDFVL